MLKYYLRCRLLDLELGTFKIQSEPRRMGVATFSVLPVATDFF
jgi:hypothetical protein